MPPATLLAAAGWLEAGAPGRGKTGRTRMPLDIAAADAILADNFAAWVMATGIKAEAAGTDTATLRIPFSDQLCRVGGILCGQALLTGADTAMVIALASASGGFRPCTTVDLTINYMRPITRADAILAAKVMRLGKTLAFCTCEIGEAGGSNPAAFSTGTYALLG
jgi:uncharacterized protein (TIGR00369 family)